MGGTEIIGPAIANNMQNANNKRRHQKGKELFFSFLLSTVIFLSFRICSDNLYIVYLSLFYYINIFNKNLFDLILLYK